MAGGDAWARRLATMSLVVVSLAYLAGWGVVLVGFVTPEPPRREVEAHLAHLQHWADLYMATALIAAVLDAMAIAAGIAALVKLGPAEESPRRRASWGLGLGVLGLAGVFFLFVMGGGLLL